MTTICFVDIETDSLRPDAQIWEIGIILRHVTDGGPAEAEGLHRWLLPIDVTRSDPMALDVGRFHQRHPAGNDYDHALDEVLCPPCEAAREIARLTDGATLAGISIDFDALRIERFLLRHGHRPSWNYRLADVRTLAAGRLQVPLPWETEALAAKLGVEEPTDDERHTALGDAAHAARIWDAVYAGGGA